MTERELFALENRLFAELESAKGLKKLANLKDHVTHQRKGK